jgi:DNA-binding GntR family transcriptional regulator
MSSVPDKNDVVLSLAGARGGAADDEPVALQKHVERRVIRDITNGVFQAGERLAPNKLAVVYGVSHIPVREALSGLQAIGYVDHRPRIGYFVTEMSREDLEDIYRWRMALEDAAHNHAVPRLTERDLARLRELHNAMAELTSAADRHEYLTLNRVFHFVAFERSESERLLRFLGYLWDATERYTYTRKVASSEPAQRSHARLLEAFERRDPRLVNAIMYEHRLGTLSSHDI